MLSMAVNLYYEQTLEFLAYPHLLGFTKDDTWTCNIFGFTKCPVGECHIVECVCDIPV